MLTKKIAGEIVEQTMIRLNRNVNIMDHQGTIIASGDRNRIDHLHEGALEVLRTGKPVIITENSLRQWKGALPGINLPIQFQDHIIGVIGITGKPDEILEFGELVKMITEMMINQSYLASQLEWKQRMVDLAFEDLIHGEPDYDSVHERLGLLDIELQPPFQVGMIEIDHNPLKNHELIQKMKTILDEKHTLIGFLSANRLFFLSFAMPEEALKRKLIELQKLLKTTRIQPRIGLGSSVADQENIHYSFDESKFALQLGRKGQTFIPYAEIEVRALLDRMDEHAKEKFQERLLKQVSDKMIETLEVFFASNFNIGESAERMQIHRNTMIYRIKKIKEDTNYDPQLFQDAVSLQLAIWMRRMEN